MVSQCLHFSSFFIFTFRPKFILRKLCYCSLHNVSPYLLSLLSFFLELFQVRHGPSFYCCSLRIVVGENCDGDVAVVHLSEDDQGLAAGQFAAFYQGKMCIGSGVILEFWDDEGFPVCEKALEIARMEDKSKLGKPVKIKVKPEGPDVGTNEKNGSIHPSSASSKRVDAEEEVTDSLSPNWMQQVKQKILQLF